MTLGILCYVISYLTIIFTPWKHFSISKTYTPTTGMRSEQSDLAIFSTSSRNASLFCCIHFKTTTLNRNFLSSALAVLHRLIDMEPYPGKIFLLSPIFGAVQTQKFLWPPRAKRLIQFFKEKTFPKQQSLKCIVGQFDRQSEPDRCLVLCDAINVR